jgi:hypothetical protein
MAQSSLSRTFGSWRGPPFAAQGEVCRLMPESLHSPYASCERPFSCSRRRLIAPTEAAKLRRLWLIRPVHPGNLVSKTFAKS